MFNYSIKTKAILLVVLVAILIFVIVFVRYNNSRSNDLELVQQVKTLANSLEDYREKFNAYPVAEKTDVEQILNITDKGFNSDGDLVYFVKNFKWVGGATYMSDGKQYAIDFSLNNPWDVWSIAKMSGGDCRMATNMLMQCVDKP